MALAATTQNLNQNTGIRTPRRNSDVRMSIMMPSKGLLNAPGENNCFLNSGVQVLWHLDVFRRSYRLFKGHACLGEACIFCALKEIFQQFQDSEQDALPSNILRIAMAKAFQDQARFQLGRMDDAAECFENILSRLHFHMAFPEPEDTCDAKHCITHQKFAMQVLEQVSCRCGATSEPMPFFQTVHYISASAMVEEAEDLRNDGAGRICSFGKLLKKTSLHGEYRVCPDEKRCTFKNKRPIQTTVHQMLTNSPDVVSIGINWNTDRPDADYIADLMDCIGQRLCLAELFDNVMDEEIKRIRYNLVGLVAYYGKHYTTFLFNTREQTWTYFDDARVVNVGQRWDLVKRKCQRGHFQPLLLLYANPTGEAIDPSDGPTAVTPVTNDEIKAAQHYKQPEKRRKLSSISRSVSLKSPEPIIKEVSIELEEAAPPRSKTDDDIPKEKSRLDTNHLSNRRTHKKSKSISKLIGSRLKGFRKLPSPPMKRSIKSISEPSSPRHNHNAIIRSKSPVNGSVKTLVNQPINNDDRSIHVPIEFERSENIITEQYLKSDERPTQEINVELSDSNLSDYDNTDGGYVSRSNSGESEGIAAPLGNRVDHAASNEVLIEVNSKSIDLQGQYEDMINEAEECISRSDDAEQLGDLLSALNLCVNANKCYRNASKLQDISDSLQRYADTKRWESFNRTKLLRQKLDKKNASVDGYASSDYGSCRSDSSGSPVVPYSTDLSEQDIAELLSSQRRRDEETKYNTQTRSNDSREREPPSTDIDLSYSVYRELPRKSSPKLSQTRKQHKVVERRPSISEIEALDSLLQDFDSNSLNSPKDYHDTYHHTRRDQRNQQPILQWVNDNKQGSYTKGSDETVRNRQRAVSEQWTRIPVQTHGYNSRRSSSGPPPPPTYDEVVLGNFTNQQERVINRQSHSIGNLSKTRFTDIQRHVDRLNERSLSCCEQCGQRIDGGRVFCQRCRSDYV